MENEVAQGPVTPSTVVGDQQRDAVAGAGVSGRFAHVPVQVDWRGGLRFEAGRLDGPKVLVDADARDAPSPVDLLLGALATCAATDVVEILRKQRSTLEALGIRVESQRVNEIPRRLASAVLHFTLRGTDITERNAARAVELAVTKYCSVRSSLLAEVPVTWTIAINP